MQIPSPRPRTRPALPALLCVLALLLGATAARADDYGEALSLFNRGKNSESLERIARALSKKPRDVRLRFLRARVLESEADWMEAEEEYLSLTRDFPELPEPYNNLAAVLARLGRLDEARAQLELALRAKPNYAEAKENLGDIYVRLAADSYRQAAASDKGSAALNLKRQRLAQFFSTESADNAADAGAANPKPVAPPNP